MKVEYRCQVCKAINQSAGLVTIFHCVKCGSPNLYPKAEDVVFKDTEEIKAIVSIPDPSLIGQNVLSINGVPVEQFKGNVRLDTPKKKYRVKSRRHK